MRTVAYLRWSPPGSSLRVEFLPSLLNELERDPSGLGWGVLYGTRHAAEVRLLAARHQPDDTDPRLATWAVRGVYFRRPRGDLFLTEADLGKFLETGADVALVVCGTRAGFFIREADGTVDSLRTPEEFTVPVPSRKKSIRATAGAAGESLRKKFPWSLVGAATLFLFALVLGEAVYVRPLLPQPLALTLSEEAGQMLISWNPRASLEGGKLEIADGAHTVTTDIQSGQRSTTFQPQNRHVAVTVSSNPSLGRYFSETASFQVTGPPAPPPPRIRATGEDLEALEREVQQMQASLAAGHQQAHNLELRIRWLMDRLHNNPASMRR